MTDYSSSIALVGNPRHFFKLPLYAKSSFFNDPSHGYFIKEYLDRFSFLLELQYVRIPIEK